MQPAWLFIVLVFSSSSRHWSATANTVTCEAVSPEPASCRRRDCTADTGPTAGAESGRGCLERPSCSTDREGDVAKDGEGNVHPIDVSGLPNFTNDSSSIGHCPSVPHPDNLLNTGNCSGYENVGISCAENLTITYKPINSNFYTLTVKWEYFKNNPTYNGAKAYRLFVYSHRQKISYCVCINSTLNLTEYSLTLEYPNTSVVNPIIDTISVITFPHPNYECPTAELKDQRSPVNCSDYQSGLPYNSSKCGIPYYGKPRNVQVQEKGTHTVLSWDRPCYEDSNACWLLDMGDSARPVPDTYYLTATVNNVTNYFVIYNVTEVALSTTEHIDFKLYAHTPCSGVCDDFPDGCSLPATSVDEPDNQTCCESASPTASSTTTPTLPRHTSPADNSKIYVLVGSIGAVMAFALVALVIIAIMAYCRTSKPDYEPQVNSEITTPQPCAVLVVVSPRSSEKDSQAIRKHLVRDLTEYNIESAMYGMDMLRQSVSEWIETWHGKASAVLCVCNREFFEDWTGGCNGTDSNPQVVHAIKQLFEGDMLRTPFGTRNYAVIKMTDTDDEFIPPLLKSRSAFMYYQTREIACFAQNEREYYMSVT